MRTGNAERAGGAGGRGLAVRLGAAAATPALAALLLVPAALLAAEKQGRRPPPERPAEAKPAEESARRIVGTILYPPRMQARRESSAPKLLTAEVREMTSRALDYIRKSQHANGSWGDVQFPENGGVTALCCLALLAGGSQPNVGDYGRELTRGLEYLLEQAKDDGQILGKNTYRYGPMYDHAWATLCLLQAYGTMPWRRDYRDKAARAVQVLLRYQKLDGGWRYAMMKEGASDSLVTLNVLLTLRVAIKAGFSVPQDVLDRAVAFIRSNGIPDGRWYYLRSGRPGSVAISGCGSIAIYGAGGFKDPLAWAANDYILRHYQRHSVRDLLEDPDSPYAVYGCFYTSQAMYMAGDKYWVPWFEKAAELFKAAQRESGEFPDGYGNKVYPTAVAAVVMQAPYGYLPLYQR